MHCASCALNIERKLKKVPGVKSAVVNYASEKATVDAGDDVEAEALSRAVTVNPQFANARYFLSAVYAKQGDMKNALVEMQAIADMSSDNAKAVAPQLKELAAGRNPFPANLLSASPTAVK